MLGTIVVVGWFGGRQKVSLVPFLLREFRVLTAVFRVAYTTRRCSGDNGCWPRAVWRPRKRPSHQAKADVTDVPADGRTGPTMPRNHNSLGYTGLWKRNCLTGNGTRTCGDA